MIIVEFDFKFHRPGKYIGHPQGKLFLRVWFAWIALTYTQYDLAQLIRDAGSGKTGWVK